MVPLAAVVPNPDQPRKHFAEAALADLAASIQARGLLQPIVVRRMPDGYRAAGRRAAIPRGEGGGPRSRAGADP